MVVLIQFVVNFFPMSLPVELILVPLISFLVIMSEYSDQKPEYAAAKKLFNWLLTFFGLFVIGYIARNVYLRHAELMNRDVLLSLLLPIWLTLLILPFLYLAKLVGTYENLFVRISFYVKDGALATYVKKRIIRRCHLSITRVNQFTIDGLHALGGVENRQGVDQLFMKIHSKAER